MIDTMTSPNIDLSSWDILYKYVYLSMYASTHPPIHPSINLFNSFFFCHSVCIFTHQSSFSSTGPFIRAITVNQNSHSSDAKPLSPTQSQEMNNYIRSRLYTLGSEGCSIKHVAPAAI
jgi:hypothetical protein